MIPCPLCDHIEATYESVLVLVGLDHVAEVVALFLLCENIPGDPSKGLREPDSLLILWQVMTNSYDIIYHIINEISWWRTQDNIDQSVNDDLTFLDQILPDEDLIWVNVHKDFAHLLGNLIIISLLTLWGDGGYVIVQVNEQVYEERSMSLDGFHVLYSNPNNPGIQQALEIWCRVKDPLIRLQQSAAESKEIESDLGVVLEPVEIRQHMLYGVAAYVVEYLLEYVVVIAVLVVVTEAELDCVYEACQMILFVALDNYLKELNQILIEVSSKDSQAGFDYPDRELDNIIQIGELVDQVLHELPDLLKELAEWVSFNSLLQTLTVFEKISNQVQVALDLMQGDIIDFILAQLPSLLLIHVLEAVDLTHEWHYQGLDDPFQELLTNLVILARHHQLCNSIKNELVFSPVGPVVS